jgi:hypothetical protein
MRFEKRGSRAGARRPRTVVLRNQLTACAGYFNCVAATTAISTPSIAAENKKWRNASVIGLSFSVIPAAGPRYDFLNLKKHADWA